LLGTEDRSGWCGGDRSARSPCCERTPPRPRETAPQADRGGPPLRAMRRCRPAYSGQSWRLLGACGREGWGAISRSTLPSLIHCFDWGSRTRVPGPDGGSTGRTSRISFSARSRGPLERMGAASSPSARMIPARRCNDARSRLRSVDRKFHLGFRPPW